MPIHTRRRRGATLGLVAVVTLVVILIGIAIFFLCKILGGGRELANATDAGVLNVAKAAMKNPSKDALGFSNPDVGTNFALLGESPRNLNLMNYNRLVAQAILVALNARDEATAESAANARKVWTAVNDVGAYLRSNLENDSYMGSYFQSIVDANNVKMLGNGGIGLGEYQIAYLKKGGSTNIFVDPRILSTFTTPPAIPVNSGGGGSPTGNRYLAGYQPFSVNLGNGDNLTFSGVTVNPQDRPHLVSLTDFLWNNKDDFVAGKGAPAYPSNTLPPNTFKSIGTTLEAKTRTTTGAVACAIVGALDREYEMHIPYGYIEIKNEGSYARPNSGLAYFNKDIFCHALAAHGIAVAGDEKWFCRGSDLNVTDTKSLDTSFNGIPSLTAQIQAQVDALNDPSVNDPSRAVPLLETKRELEHLQSTMTIGTDLIDRWAMVNALSAGTRRVLWDANIPDRAISLRYIRKGNGDVLVEDDLKLISSYTGWVCHWQMYDGRDMASGNFRGSGNGRDCPCLKMLPAFKKGYDEYGSTESSFRSDHLTAIERFKADVMAARVNCSDCAGVQAPSRKTGMKWFDQKIAYPAPKNPYDFGEERTPYEYLQMIDKIADSGNCALNTVFNKLLKRCQQISPKVTGDDLKHALMSERLKLNQTLYLYMSNGQLSLRKEKPDWAAPNTVADGKTPTVQEACGAPYNVMTKLVCTNSGHQEDWTLGDLSRADATNLAVRQDDRTDGYFPGWAWKSVPQGTCRDQAIWTPSSGYNNLLGVLNFQNGCEGGGSFCQPN